MTIQDKMQKLREKMQAENIQHYLIPSADFHQSEYVSDYFKTRAYMSGFTGSAGQLLISMDKAHLWTDGRYFIMAEKELMGSDITLMKMGEEGVPTLTAWLLENAQKGHRLGVDGRVLSVSQLLTYREALKPKDIDLILTEDLVASFWADRPSMPNAKIFEHDVQFAGLSTLEKLTQVRAKMKQGSKDAAKGYVLSSLDDIAWLFNFRGGDVADTPVALSYAFVTETEAELYIEVSKVPETLLQKWLSEGVTVKPYETILERVATYKGESLYFSPSRLNAALYEAIDNGVMKVEGTDITTVLKAQKNETEINTHEQAQIRDGVAMVKFIHWLYACIGKTPITEVSAANQLEAFRAEGAHYIGKSFESISAYGANAAMMHYHPTAANCSPVEAKGFFLMDSGGQYLDGTTDITRTFAMGPLTEEEKLDYTLVLKGHIQLCKAKFLKGTTGTQLDILARQPLWAYGLDYKCGTGHGVGYCLGVHEGPQSIHPRLLDVAFELGMMTTVEPGVYKEGAHGIRIENTVLVETSEVTASGTFYAFRTISYCPIDMTGVLVSHMTHEEIQWLNAYHQMVFDKLSPHLEAPLVAFLKEKTAPIALTMS